MHNFIKPFVIPVAQRRMWKRLCEIGSREGEATDILRAIPGLQVTVIDPCLDCDLQHKFSDSSAIEMRKGLSLDVLPQLSGTFDCILIDGDHNWYTVYNELKLIFERGLLEKGGIVYLHDVDWPWARRDLYYQPETIPASQRHPYAAGAIVRGKSRLADTSGPFAGGFKALDEGGKRNGVLTAVEDFLHENEGRFRFFRVRAGYGLGILMPRNGIRGDLTYVALACKGIIYGALYRMAQLRGVRAILHSSTGDEVGPATSNK